MRIRVIAQLKASLQPLLQQCRALRLFPWHAELFLVDEPDRGDVCSSDVAEQPHRGRL